MKDQARILGIDDAQFSFGDEFTTVVGVVMRADGYLEGVMVDQVRVDGDDANKVLAAMINRSRYKKQLRLVLTDGIALGGFNVIDLQKLHKDTDLPVAAVTRNPPDFDEMKKALKSHCSNWKMRFEIICRGELFSVDTKHKPIYVKGAGMSRKELTESVKMSIIRGALPEPIRIAHIIATALAVGESKGRA